MSSHQDYLNRLRIAQEEARRRHIYESIYFPKPTQTPADFIGGRTEEEFENLFIENDYIDPDYFE